MSTYSEYYCSNENKHLKKIVDRIISKDFPWLPQCEYDEFYSISGECVWYCERRFDEGKGIEFEKYLINSLKRKFKTRITQMNRKKRNNGIPNISLDSLINEESKETLVDMIADESEKEIHPLIQRYLDSLTSLQRKVAELIMEGCNSRNIREQLNLSDDKFNMICQRMKAGDKLLPLNKLNGVRK